MKKALLVDVSFTIRLIVDENATDDEIIQATYPKLIERIANEEVGDNVVSIEEDTECPYDPDFDGVEEKCLNCGFEFIRTKLNTHKDELGEHCNCPKCQTSFDINQ
jgi:predicted Zn-ribbon and HTH transcriptional regulator